MTGGWDGQRGLTVPASGCDPAAPGATAIAFYGGGL